MTKRTRTVTIDDLKLWEGNPRVEQAKSQDDEIANIYEMGSPASPKTSHRQLMNLAESIAVNGYQNEVEPILVTQTNRGFIVRDANRRISCLKILNNPEKYKNILEEKDYKHIKQLADNYKNNIPNTLDVVVYQENEEEQLKEILARKHNGPLDGAGTVAWDTQAKDRFFNRNKSFTDKLEKPFENQFGENLTSYLGGSNAVTSTRRIFNSKPIKKFLGIKDQNNVAPEELDKVKKLADEVKAYSKQHNILLSRFNNLNIIDLLEEIKSKQFGAQPSVMDFALLNSREAKDFIRNLVTSSDRALGSQWLEAAGTHIDFNNNNFASLNAMLIALEKFGNLAGEADDRHFKMWLLAPSVRVFFELSLRGLVDSNIPSFRLPNPSVSKELNKNVQYVHDLWKDNKEFFNWLDNHKAIFDSYSETKDTIDTTQFANIAKKSNLSSHSSMKIPDEADLRNMFNVAVLFSVLSEQYVLYENSKSLSN